MDVRALTAISADPRSLEEAVAGQLAYVTPAAVLRIKRGSLSIPNRRKENGVPAVALDGINMVLGCGSRRRSLVVRTTPKNAIFQTEFRIIDAQCGDARAISGPLTRVDVSENNVNRYSGEQLTTYDR